MKNEIIIIALVWLNYNNKILLKKRVNISKVLSLFKSESNPTVLKR